MGESVRGVLDQVFLGNTLGTWLWAAMLAGGVFVGTWMLRRVLLQRARAFAERRPTGLTEMLPKLVMKTSVLVVVAAALVVGTLQLSLPPSGERLVRFALVVMLTVQAAMYGVVLVDFCIAEFIRRNRSGNDATDASLATTMTAVRFLAMVVLYSALVLLAMENLGIDVTAMIAGLGVGGIAVALAVQNILGDLFGSLSIVLDKPFVVGDFIIVGDKLGTVEKIGLKTTRLRALSGEQLIFSNMDLLSSRIQNYKRMNERRVVFSFGVEHATPLEQVQRIPGIIREAIESQERTRFDRAHFFKFGESSLDFEAVYYMLVPDYNAYMDVQQKVNFELLRRLKADGVVFAQPVRKLHVMSVPEPMQGRERVTTVVN